MERPSEDEMRSKPMTKSSMRAESTSAHAFWTRYLKQGCHPDAGLDALYRSSGALELSCHECKLLCGVLVIAEG